MIQSLAWEERNYIEQMKNYDNKKVSEIKGTTIETKTSLMQNDWKDITDPKLRKKMRLKAKSQRFKERHPEYHKEYQRKYQKKYQKEVKDKIKTSLYNKKWYEKNKEKHRAYTNNYCKERCKKDVNFKIIKVLRSRLSKAIKNHQKNGSAVNDLGCSIIEFKNYLESKFSPGMSWDNYGLYGWHIDHIKPLSAFNLSDRKQILEACHYTNLQPLWAKDNLSKSDNY